MIIWINGTFGVGKTTTARFVNHHTGWRIFDPEHVGFLLAGSLRDLDFDDFQELPPWRALVPVFAEEIFRYTNSKAMIAVQSVLVEDYWNELTKGLAERGLPVLHVVLDCGGEELRRRIETDEIEEQARDWRLDHIGSFGQARDWLAPSADVLIDTTARSPEAVARIVIDAANQNLRPAS